MLFGLYLRINMNKIEYTQMVNTVHLLNMSKMGLSQWEKYFGEKSTTCSVPALFCPCLSLDKRMRVRHVGGGVGEVDPIGQVPLLLLLLGSPAVENRFLILRNFWKEKTFGWKFELHSIQVTMLSSCQALQKNWSIKLISYLEEKRWREYSLTGPLACHQQLAEWWERRWNGVGP